MSAERTPIESRRHRLFGLTRREFLEVLSESVEEDGAIIEAILFYGDPEIVDGILDDEPTRRSNSAEQQHELTVSLEASLLCQRTGEDR